MAVDMFLKLDGIKGEAHDSKHKDEIDIYSWSWGVSNSGSMGVGGGGGSGKVAVHDVSITKQTDKASAALFLHCASGKHIKEALITVRKAGDKPLEYFKMTLSDIIVTNVQTSGSHGGDNLMENLSLNFAKYKIEYMEQKADGSGVPAGETGWDVKANIKV
jgi:type VI secretion system secreted protein Hcp